MSRVFLSLCSNYGDKEANIERALNLLSKKISCLRRSSFYETEPDGSKDQPQFLNIAAEGETALSPISLLVFTQSVERKMKRVKTITNGPRNIDIDILLYDDEIIHLPELVIPHPRMLDRAFVLAPLSELAPELVVLGQTITETLASLDDDAVRKRD